MDNIMNFTYDIVNPTDIHVLRGQLFIDYYYIFHGFKILH